jgi:hypothetical protein
MLQSLADIYSRNLFSQKGSEDSVTINTYAPTAKELIRTLDLRDQIEKNDYLDIAIYAYNILKKERVTQAFAEGAMEESSTYSYLEAFFRASHYYIGSIEEFDKKNQTLMSFARQFYDPTLKIVVNSLYKNFTVLEDGGIFLAPSYRE